MEVFAELGQIGAGIDQTLREVTGMAGGETDPFNAVHVVNVMQQIGEGVFASPFGGDAGQIASIGIDVLPQQGDFLVPLCCQTFHLELDCIRQTRLLLAAHGWHDAVCAAFIAAIDHVHPAADTAVAAGGCDVLKDVVLFSRHHLLTTVNLLQQGFQPVCVLRAHHQIQLGHAPQQ